MSPICRLTHTLHAASGARIPFDLSLYLVANRPSFQDEALFFSKIRAAVKGGVSCVQLRDHESNFATTLQQATRLKKLLKNIPLFINTRRPFDIVDAVGAQGVYLERPFPLLEARRVLGTKAILGMAVKTREELLAASQIDELDYISVKIFPSQRTCPHNDQLWGMEGLREIRACLPHRIVAIGGLKVTSVESVYRELHVQDGIAMAGGLMEEEDPCITAQKIQAIRQKVLSHTLDK